MPSIKSIAILGSTGSIGTQTLDVVSRLSDRFKIHSLAAKCRDEILVQQIERFHPQSVAVADEKDSDILSDEFPELNVLVGADGVCALAGDDEVEIVVNAVVGAAGLKPSFCALSSGKRLCTANKESLVMGGELLTIAAAMNNVQIFPIDSEHSAVWQAMLSGHKSEVERLILTASGGPFWGKDIDFDTVTPEQALKHPNWSMGAKISIDSATMINKALEIIEAHWLFGIEPENIDVLIHPQSIVHSIVEFIDGSQIAQMSLPDMRLPIQYALTYPERLHCPLEKMELSKIEHLDFFAPDNKMFPTIGFAYDVLALGGTAPAILNAANEIAVEAFLEGKIKFSHMMLLLENTMKNITYSKADSLEEIMQADMNARLYAQKAVSEIYTDCK